jgi:2-methylaconitate cis-trans-isomerase PrpF
MQPEIKRKIRHAQPMNVRSQIKKQKLKNTPEKYGNDTIAMNTKPAGPTGWELLEEPKNNNQSKSGFEIIRIYISL